MTEMYLLALAAYTVTWVALVIMSYIIGRVDGGTAGYRGGGQ